MIINIKYNYVTFFNENLVNLVWFNSEPKQLYGIIRFVNIKTKTEPNC